MKHSLRRKTIIIIIISAVILSGATIIASSRVITDMINDQYTQTAENMSATLSVTVDAEAAARLRKQVEDIYMSADNRVGSEEWGSDAFNEYIALFSDVEESPDFIALRSQMAAIQDVNDVGCVYLIFVEPKSEAFIYMVDADHEEPCPPGCFDPIYDVNRQVLTDPEIGFPAYVTNTEEYGWLVTAGTPVHNAEGELVCYAFTDIPMNKMIAYRNRVMMFLILLEMALTIAIAIIVIGRINNTVVKPVNMLSDAATGYIKEEGSYHSSFAALDIKTNNEIEDLSESMKQMERDLNDNMAHILSLTNQLDESRTVAFNMTELARKDALTGVRNKLAYDEELRSLEKSLAEGDKKFGIAVFDLDDLKGINDNYGHSKGDIAIRRMADIICNVYAHSPVFRIGGDEFTAILKGRDYDNAAQLAAECRRQFAENAGNKMLDRWERVSASVGYALYDDIRDGSVEVLFRHADNDMYNHKRAAKAGR